VSTLGFLHSQGLVHRDLKPENILLAGGRDTDIKITDFGLANIMSASAILRSKCGTPVYMAPEMLQNRPYNESVDVWAAGILLYILLSGTLPFYADDPDEFLELVLSSRCVHYCYPIQ
jgi:serine/threonine protein kinase